MTEYLIDIASWQTTEKRADPLVLSKAKAAGFDLVNIKTSQGDWYGYRSWMREYADRARELGMGISTFHWLDNTASGAAQAAIAYDRMKRLGGPEHMAHQCDCEDTTGRPASERIWRDYVAAMQDYLGRPIVNYTGDWWWEPKGWQGADLTPYLWAAPNVGYLGSYPGDASKHWTAGYGGWDSYSILQYAVSEIEGAGGGRISKSAIRDPKVWATLTGQSQEDDMPLTEADMPIIRAALHSTQIGRTGVTFGQVMDMMRGVPDKLTVLGTALAQLGVQDFTDEAAIVQGILSGLAVKPTAEVAQALVAAGQDPAALAAELYKLTAFPSNLNNHA